MEARARWNERHGATVAAGTVDDSPSPWLAEQAPVLAARAPGRALDVGCGLGRHALMLAGLGFEVDALDVSDVAVERLAAVARERRLAIAAAQTDLGERPVLPRPPYDVIVDVNFLERPLLPVLADALGPDGLLAVEGFLADPEAGWGPTRPAFVLARGELPALLEGLEGLDVVSYAEVEQHGRVKARALARRRAVTPPGAV